MTAAWRPNERMRPRPPTAAIGPKVERPCAPGRSPGLRGGVCDPPSRAWGTVAEWSATTRLPLRGQRRNCITVRRSCAPDFPFHPLRRQPRGAPEACAGYAIGKRRVKPGCAGECGALVSRKRKKPAGAGFEAVCAACAAGRGTPATCVAIRQRADGRSPPSPPTVLPADGAADARTARRAARFPAARRPRRSR